MSQNTEGVSDLEIELRHKADNSEKNILLNNYIVVLMAKKGVCSESTLEN